MKMKKQNLVAIMLGLGLGFSVTTANAWFVFDPLRTAEFVIQGVQRMLSYVSEAQKVDSKEEEKKIWETRKNNKEALGSGEGESEGGSGKADDKPKK